MDETAAQVEVRFRAFYAAFNARDVDAVLAGMTPDVDWANGMTSGRVHGRDAVRAYWTAQWAELDPRVEPTRVVAAGDGRVVVDVRQVVRDRAGALLVDQTVRHVYGLRDGLVARMDIEAVSD
jgi:hypothetical protein